MTKSDYSKDYSKLPIMKEDLGNQVIEADSAINLKYFSISYNDITDSEIFENFKFGLSRSNV